MYKDDDIIITDINEIMTFADSKKYYASVYRIATKTEAELYEKECEYWRKNLNEPCLECDGCHYFRQACV